MNTQKIFSTLISIGILANILTLNNFASAQTIPQYNPNKYEHLNNFGHIYLVDTEDNNNPQYNAPFHEGSRIYGYIYQPNFSFYGYGTPVNMIEYNFIYSIPEGMCMNKEGLPAELPINISNYDANNLTKENIDITLDTLAPQGANHKTYIRDQNSQFFYYSTNHGADWTEYNSRTGEGLPENCEITDIKIPIDIENRKIYTYNLTVKDPNIQEIKNEVTHLVNEYIMIEDQMLYHNYPHTNSITLKNHTTTKLECSEAPIDIYINPTIPNIPSTNTGSTSTPPSNPPTLPSAPSTPPSTPSGPGGYNPNTPVTPFTPVSIANKCQAIVKNLDDAKLIEYYKKLQVETGLNVHGDISRLDLVRLAVNAGYLNIDANEDTSVLSDFADVAKNSWYAPYIAKIIKKDILSLGELNTNEQNLKLFGTNNTISREDAVKILTNIITEKNLRLPTLDEILTFSDVHKTDKNADYIQFAYDSCLLHGRKTLNGEPIDGKPRVFEANSNITIAETAKILLNGQSLR